MGRPWKKYNWKCLGLPGVRVLCYNCQPPLQHVIGFRSLKPSSDFVSRSPRIGSINALAGGGGGGGGTVEMQLLFRISRNSEVLRKFVNSDIKYRSLSQNSLTLTKIANIFLCRWFRFAQLAKGKKFRP
jgi:hypothetical protein